MDWFIALAVSTLLGFLTGLGIGGGSLLMLWLTLAAGMSQAETRGINLLYFLPSALLACIFRWKQGRLDLRKIWPAMVAGAAAAAGFSLWGSRLDTALLEKPFGFLLLLTGLRELCYRPRKAK